MFPVPRKKMNLTEEFQKYASLPLLAPLLTDSYKLSHGVQYVPGCRQAYSYGESRGGKFDSILFNGLQPILMRFFQGVQVTHQDVKLAKLFSAKHFGSDKVFKEEGWNTIVNKYGGRLPLVIRAVPEGTVVPTHNILFDVYNRAENDGLAWLTNYVEGLLQQVWYPCTVGTISYMCRKLILSYLERTGDPSTIDFKLHDFGFRAATCPEQAAIGGCSHLINFRGSDTIVGIIAAMYYYNADVCGFSIPAGEHSTYTSWGREHEVEALKNMLDQYPAGTIAAVSDQYDIFNACANIWGTELRQQVLDRDGVLVIRPDSGDPVKVIIKCLDILREKFGGSVNEKGYYVLNPKVRLIWGDGINYDSLNDILLCVTMHPFGMCKGYSADNLAFGMGGGLLQQCNRDTQKFAVKTSDVLVGEEHRDVYKDPVTDHGKRSKRGRLKLIKENGVFRTVRESEPGENILVPVCDTGELLVKYDFDQLIANALAA